MSRATPTRQTGELDEKLQRDEELRAELDKLQKKLDTRNEEHKMEVSRLKMDNRKVLDDFKSANNELQRNWDMS